MAKNKMKEFKKKLSENSGASMDGRKVNGILKQEYVSYDTVAIQINNEVKVKVETNIPRLSFEDRADLKSQVKELLNGNIDFKEGDKIDLSKYIDTPFSLIYNGATTKTSINNQILCIEHKFLAC